MSDYLGQSIPKLGFGLMRMPLYGKSTTRVDVLQVKYMVDRFLEAGFKYFDTAYSYNHGIGLTAIQDALVNRHPRENYYLATKLPAWMAASKEDAQQMFYTSLEGTGAGYFDFYLLEEMGQGRTEAFDNYDIWNFLAARMEEGQIRHLGFSFTGTAKELDAILTAHPETEFVQLQINYADWENSAAQTKLCYETARKHAKPVVAAAPLKGGLLANPPYEAASVLRDTAPMNSLASWGIRFATSLDGIITVVCSVSNSAQMNDNIETMRNFRPIEGDDAAAIQKARAAIETISTIPCNGCYACVSVCPQKVVVPLAFDAANQLSVYGNKKLVISDYAVTKELNVFAAAAVCNGCGHCEPVCPQKIDIVEELKKASAVLEV